MQKTPWATSYMISEDMNTYFIWMPLILRIYTPREVSEASNGEVTVQMLKELTVSFPNLFMLSNALKLGVLISDLTSNSFDIYLLVHEWPY